MKSNSILKYAAVIAVLAVAGVAGWLVAATAFTPANQPSGYLGQLEATSYNLSSGHEIIFKTDYERTAWSGNVLAYPVSAAGVINFPAEIWSGGVKVHLDVQNPDTGRIIVTRDASGVNIPFRWGNLSNSQQTAMGPAGSVGGASSTVLDYVRGARTNEGVAPLSYRSRLSVLGDIMHSRPYYLANGGAPVLFVGANDGMLHAFDASATGGNELWAYIPSMLIPNLSALKVDPYVHTYFVDGGLNVGDAVISGATKKVLVSGLGAGGRGMFALDVTNPIPADEATAKAKILWEITNTTKNSVASGSYANMGYTYGTPVIGKAYGQSDSVIIMGNGYNNIGNGHSSLYIINAANGTRIQEIDTAAPPSGTGGLSTPACVDTGVRGLSGSPDGKIDYCYAGDVDGNLWKFDLTADSGAWPPATLVYTTSPAQTITMAPSVATHPNGGLMINFGTGQMFATTDVADTTVYYAWGIWDAFAAAANGNTGIQTQTLTEKAYTSAGTTTRVRVASSNAMNWTAGVGATFHKGWKVALPAGERIIADTVFTASGRFYFNAYNPTIDNHLLTPATPDGENWLMELDYLSGGVTNSPFLDLNGDQLLTDADRIVYASGDTIPGGKAVGDAITTAQGVPVGKFITNGVSSHPILVQLATLNTTLLNQNPDVIIPPPPATRGVAGGHFDVDIYYGTPTICTYGAGVAARGATATITVASTGNVNGARLGASGGAGITVGGVTIMNALTTADITNGTATTANAATIASRINSLTGTSGYSASSSGAVVTVTSPIGPSYNGGTLAFLDGTAVSGTSGSSPTGSFNITNASSRRKYITPITCAGGNTINTNSVWTGNNSSTTTPVGTQYVRNLASGLNANGSNGYSYSCTTPASGTTSSTCTVTGPVGPAACAFLSITKDTSISVSTTSPGFTGGAIGTAIDNLAPSLTAGGSFAGGAVASLGAFQSCRYDTHFHEYDKIFDKTGVNMLNASSTSLNLVNAIPNAGTGFKVLVHNQYMNPAVTLSVGGNPHENVKTWNNQASETIAANVIANAPTYTRATPGMTLEWNMPTTAFQARDWWGNGDVRVGLMPTTPYCLFNETDANHGKTLFHPVNPPNPMTASGNGTVNNTTGARHNGALTVQIIRDTTPESAIELNVANDPTFGWRVKAADFETYVLVEYNTYWHYPNGVCWGATGNMGGGTYNPITAGWTKAPPQDLVPTNPTVFRTPAAGSDDPSTGSFRSTGTVTDVQTTLSTVTVAGVVLQVTTTVTTYSNNTTKTVVKTVNNDGTTTIVTTQPDGTVSTVTLATQSGTVKTGGDEKGSQAKTGRVSWSELLRN